MSERGSDWPMTFSCESGTSGALAGGVSSAASAATSP